MAKSKEAMYRVVISREDGTFETQEITTDEDPPKKGDSFEYEHREVRTSQIIRVTRLLDDGTEEVLSEIGDTMHPLAEAIEEDEDVDVGDLVHDEFAGVGAENGS